MGAFPNIEKITRESILTCIKKTSKCHKFIDKIQIPPLSFREAGKQKLLGNMSALTHS